MNTQPKNNGKGHPRYSLKRQPQAPQLDTQSKLAKLLDNYLDWMTVRGYATSTLRARRNNVGYFILWCEQSS